MNGNKEHIRLSTWIIVGIAAIFIVGSFVFYLYSGYQQKKVASEEINRKQQELLSEQQKALDQTKKEIEDLKRDSDLDKQDLANESTEKVDIVPPNTTFCNGKYWINCPTGQRFECPSSGDAKCTIVNTQNIQSLQQECLTRGLQMVNEESNKSPSYTDLINQKNALLISLYPNSTRSSGEPATITSEEYASLTSSQKSAIDSNNITAVETELDSVNVKLRVEDNRISNLDDYLYMVRLVCGTVTTEQQIIHELQKIKESLNK